MDIKKTSEDSSLTLEIIGRIDTVTAPQLEESLKENLGGMTELILDFTKVEYISSAGLRVLLSTQKRMNTQGNMIIRNINDTVREVFEVTGFTDILTIQ
ncbi:MAG: anti-sigma factor antagonist [Erysipelotrichia bacterium]|nr:anti-sigma factor antagonist [Erysipelotrichia bacterium]